jgi:hypothetical protein
MKNKVLAESRDRKAGNGLRFIDVTVRISPHASPRLYAAFMETGGGKDGAALLRQLSEEALIRREGIAAERNSPQQRREVLTRAAKVVPEPAHRAQDDEHVKKALTQFD